MSIDDDLRPMSIDDELFFLLYLVNVLQPVSRNDLKNEFDKPTRRDRGRKKGRRMNLDRAIRLLVRNGHIVERSRGYSVTPFGFNTIHAFGLDRIRDKHRLFHLSRLL